MEMSNPKKKGLLALAIYILIFSLGAILVSFAVEVGYMLMGMDILEENNYTFASALINLITYIILLAALLLLYRKDLVVEFKDLKKYSKGALVVKIIAGFGIFYAISMFGNAIVSNIEYYADIVYKIFKLGSFDATSDNQASIEAMLQGPSFAMMFLAAGFMGPLCEELVFRKALFATCKSKTTAILVSSILFGFIHVSTAFFMYDATVAFLMLFPYVISGVALAVVYIKGDCNIWIPTIAHMLSNIISMVAILFAF